MRFIIADPGLLVQTGHHLNECRYIAEAARARGFDVRIFGHLDVEAGIERAVGAVPHFTTYTYLDTDKDPFCGWLSAFITTKEATCRDFRRMGAVSRDDIVIVHGARAAQLMAAAEWAAGLPEDECPLIVVVLGGGSGAEVKQMPDGSRGVVPPNPSLSPQPALCRFAAQFSPALGRRPFHVITYHADVSAIYSLIMQREVGVLPFPTPATTVPRDRSGQRPITIATLGHQQIVKGYLLMPDIISNLLETESDIRFLVHNSDPDHQYTGASTVLKETQRRLEDMAARDPRIILENRAVDFEEWPKLVASCDVILCPYDLNYYAVGHSGLASAAVANGIPLVAPLGTTLAKWIDEYGNIGTTFEEQNVASVSAALRKVVREFDVYAVGAFAAARTWASTQGPEGFVNGVLDLRQRRSAFAEAAGKPLNELSANMLKAKGDQDMREGNLDRARDMYRAAIGEYAPYVEAYCNLGVVLYRSGDLAGAEAALRQAYQLDPSRVSVLTNLGSVLCAADKNDEAISLLTEAIAIDPGNGWLRNNLASALAKLGRYADAVGELEQSVRDMPTEATLWFSLGTAREATGNVVGAIEAYHKTLDLRDDHQDARARAAALRAGESNIPHVDRA